MPEARLKRTREAYARYELARREFDAAVSTAEAAGASVITRDQVPHFDDMLDSVRELQALHRAMESQ